MSMVTRRNWKELEGELHKLLNKMMFKVKNLLQMITKFKARSRHDAIEAERVVKSELYRKTKNSLKCSITN